MRRDRKFDRATLAAFGSVTLFVVGLVAIIWFLARKGTDAGDQWASMLTFVLTWIVLVGQLALRMVQHATARRPQREELLERLRGVAKHVIPANRRGSAVMQLSLTPTALTNVQARNVLQRFRKNQPPASLESGTTPEAQLHAALSHREIRQIVLLGSAGSGKTTLAGHYASWAARTEDSAPVVVPMSVKGWRPDDEPLREWAARRIAVQDSRIPVSRVADLMSAGLVIPILDGLDEMPEKERGAALTEIVRAERDLKAIVTSRPQEFIDAVREQGVLPDALVFDLQPVSADAAVEFLTASETSDSRRWTIVERELARPGSPVADALKTPLMIALARKQYESRGSDPDELAALGSADIIRDRLLGEFLPTAYPDKTEADRAKQWLSRLDSLLVAEDNAGELAWWKLIRKVPWPFVIAVFVATLSIVGAICGLALSAFGIGSALGGAALGGCAGLVAADQTLRAHEPAHGSTGPLQAVGRGVGRLWATLGIFAVCGTVAVFMLRVADPAAAQRVAMAVVDIHAEPTLFANRVSEFADGHIGWLAVAALFAALTVPSLAANGQVPAIRPRLVTLPVFLLSAVAAAVALSIIISLLVEDDGGAVGDVVEMTTDSLPATAVIAILLWIVQYWVGVEAEPPAGPVDAFRRDRAGTLVQAGSLTMLTALVAYAILADSLDLARVAAVGLLSCGFGAFLLASSGSAWIGVAVARLWFGLLGQLPWRLMSTLDDAQERGVLRTAGAAYRIRHDLVRVRFDHATKNPRRLSASRSFATGPVSVLVASVVMALAAVVADPRPTFTTAIDLDDPSISGDSDYPFATGSILVTRSADGTVRLWDTDTYTLRHTIALPTTFEMMDIDSDSGVMAVGAATGDVEMWNLRTMDQTSIFKVRATLEGVFLADGGAAVVTVDAQRSVQLWRADGRLLVDLAGSIKADEIRIADDGGVLLLASDPPSALRVSARAGTVQARVVGTRATLDGSDWLSLDSADPTSIQGSATASTALTFDGSRYELFVSPDGGTILAWNGQLGLQEIWDSHTGRLRTSFSPSDVVVTAHDQPRLSDDGRFLIVDQGTPSSRQHMAIWSAQSGAFIGSFQNALLSARGTVAYPDGGATVLFDLNSGRVAARISRARALPEAFVAAGEYLVTSDVGDGGERLWRLDGTEVRPGYAATDYTFDDESPPLMVAMLSSDQNALSIWDLREGREVRVVPVGDPDRIAFASPYLLVTDDSRTAVWDLRSGMRPCETQIDETSGGSTELDIKPDDPLRAVLVADGYVYLYDISECRPILSLGHNVEPSFGSNGHTIELRYDDPPLIRIWRLPPQGV